MISILIFLSLFIFVSDISATENDTLSLYYSKNLSFVNIIDSISSINPDRKNKEFYQKQNFLVYLMKNDDEELYMYIFHFIFYDDEVKKKDEPFGCVIKNDSFFYLVNKGLDESDIGLLFNKTQNYIISDIIQGNNTVWEEDIEGNKSFFTYRASKLFKLVDGSFIGTHSQ